MNLVDSTFQKKDTLHTASIESTLSSAVERKDREDANNRNWAKRQIIKRRAYSKNTDIFKRKRIK